MSDELESQDIVLSLEIRKLPPLQKCMNVLLDFWHKSNSNTLIIHSTIEPDFKLGLFLRHIVYTEVDCTFFIIDGWINCDDEILNGRICEVLFIEKDIPPIKSLKFWCISAEKSKNFVKYTFTNKVVLIFISKEKFFSFESIDNLENLIWCRFDPSDNESKRFHEVISKKTKKNFITVNVTQSELFEKELLLNNSNCNYEFVTMEGNSDEERKIYFPMN